MPRPSRPHTTAGTDKTGVRQVLAKLASVGANNVYMLCRSVRTERRYVPCNSGVSCIFHNPTDLRQACNQQFSTIESSTVTYTTTQPTALTYKHTHAKKATEGMLVMLSICGKLRTHAHAVCCAVSAVQMSALCQLMCTHLCKSCTQPTPALHGTTPMSCDTHTVPGHTHTFNHRPIMCEVK
jgi:hypothetical protein